MGSYEFALDEGREGTTLQPIVFAPLRFVVHQVPRVGVPRELRCVVVTLVQEFARKNRQTAAFHLQRHKILVSVVYLMIALFIGDFVCDF